MSERFKNTEEHINFLRKQIAIKDEIINLLIRIILLQQSINEPIGIEDNKGNTNSINVENDSNLLNTITILQKQLNVKDEQLERKDVQIKDLSKYFEILQKDGN